MQCVNGSPKNVNLNANHSNFILIENLAYRNKFGGEIKSRTKLENYLKKKFKIPLILLALEGGPG